jgi:hypothetical protein
MKVRTFSVFALVFGLALLLAFAAAIEEAQMKGADQAILHVEPAGPPANLAAPQDPTRLAHTLQITFTPVATVYLPLLVNNYLPPFSYFDDFSDPGSGWHIIDIGDVRVGYQDGEYEILLRYELWSAGILAPIDAVGDCSVEADIRRHAGSEGLYGLIFGLASWDHFYTFIVDPDRGYYTVILEETGDWSPVIDWTFSPYINSSPNVANHLKVEHKGGQITLYINGHLLTTANADANTGCLRVGLHADSASSFDPVSIRFDNFRVSGQ